MAPVPAPALLDSGLGREGRSRRPAPQHRGPRDAREKQGDQGETVKQNILLVDADARSRRLLEVSLRKAGYSITSVESAEEALEIARESAPDLVLTDTQLPAMDGFALVGRIREDAALARTPLVFLSSDTSLASKVKGLELGVEYLTKPIYIREVLTRIGLELDRASRKVIELKSDRETRFSGTLSDMGLVDLLQTIDVSRKGGILWIRSSRGEGRLWFERGQVVDAETGSLRGELAVYRFLTWSEGTFEITFGDIDRKPTLAVTTQSLLMEGMRRVDDWARLAEQVPPLDRVLDVDGAKLVDKLALLPDAANAVLKKFDGTRSLVDVIEGEEGDDLETMRIIADLVFEGVLVESAAAPLARAVGAHTQSASGPRPSGAQATGTQGTSVAAAKGKELPANPPVGAGTLLMFPGKDAADVAPRPNESESRPSAPPAATPVARRSERPSVRPLHENPEEEGFFSDRETVEVVDTWDPRAARDSVRPNTDRLAWGAIGLALALTVLVGSLYMANQVITEREAARVGEHQPMPSLPAPEVPFVPEPIPEEAPTVDPTPAGEGESGPAEALAPNEPTPVEAPPTEVVIAPVEAPAAAGSLAEAAPTPADAVPPVDPAAAPSYAELLAAADAYAAKHKSKPAEEAYRAALLAEPNGALALEGLAFLQLNRGRNKEASELAARATALSPTSSRAWITLGASLQALGRVQEARVAYTRCVSEGQGPFVRDCRLMLR